MRHDKLVPGAILITLGIIFLLRSFGVVHIHWMNFLHLWPIFLLIGGINLIFAHNRSPLASGLKIGVVLLGLCILLFGNFNNRYNFWPGRYYYHSDNNNNDSDDDDNDDKVDVVKVGGTSTFNEPYNAATKIAKLNINGGGTMYRLSDTTTDLFQAYTKEIAGSYEFTRHNEDSVYVLDFSMKKNNHMRWDKGKENSATFKLNTAPVWDMDISTGATKLDFDLSKFKIRNLDINGGAASFDIKMGQPLASTNIDISTGVSEVNIRIPKDAACKIDTDSGLSSNHFDGFNKTDDDTYETPGYSSAKNKIHIKLDGGLSGFRVTRY
ncbi:hypothetical protein HQ865_05580 [Mucilaginibacter mali]|uniref:LiaI-LiaF-like transmembrane region domain-containing protein n=1 Tax=Mucilaginibacter mali TaxID=2740462 RepID=A0A7D4Q7M4_9SPHI|nr:DUF5668 domain-containing protein [Mucilaginibacter mali]QKJ29245.1 hypothetical protein HQ865_05580 [Mucilaginibacter mali]